MSYSMVKSPERIRLFGVKTLQRSNTSDAMSLADSQSLMGKIPFITTCDVKQFAEMGHLQKDVFRPTCQPIEGTPC